MWALLARIPLRERETTCATCLVFAAVTIFVPLMAAIVAPDTIAELGWFARDYVGCAWLGSLFMLFAITGKILHHSCVMDNTALDTMDETRRQNDRSRILARRQRKRRRLRERRRMGALGFP